jgi:hypothetical protein
MSQKTARGVFSNPLGQRFPDYSSLFPAPFHQRIWRSSNKKGKTFLPCLSLFVNLF